jgi:hypothetical protein
MISDYSKFAEQASSIVEFDYYYAIFANFTVIDYWIFAASISQEMLNECNSGPTSGNALK